MINSPRSLQACAQLGVEPSEFGAVSVLVSLNAYAATPIVGLDYIGLGIIVGVIVIQVLGHPCLSANGNRLVILPVAGIFKEPEAGTGWVYRFRRTGLNRGTGFHRRT